MAYTTINKPTDYFNTKLYTGTVSSQSITGVGFQPDWVWIKYRSDSANHHLYDSVRGVQKRLNSNTTNAEATSVNNLTSFDSDGFTIGTDNDINESGQTYASWNWKANGAGSSNTDGSITSTVNANTTSGFSIVSYTGNATSGETIGHGLGVKPRMIILKRRDSTSQWPVYDAINGATKYMTLNQTDVTSLSLSRWNNTEPTASVFSVGNSAEVNASGGTYIAYCFADVKGFSKFGSYVGNGSSTDGTFVYTGFSPSFVMLKRTTDSIGSWTMYDNKRHTYNPNGEYLLANDSGSSVDFDNVDFLSNGFKLRAGFNNASSSYIYMSFAEAPLVGSNNIPATAR